MGAARSADLYFAEIAPQLIRQAGLVEEVEVGGFQQVPGNNAMPETAGYGACIRHGKQRRMACDPRDLRERLSKIRNVFQNFGADGGMKVAVLESSRERAVVESDAIVDFRKDLRMQTIGI